MKICYVEIQSSSQILADKKPNEAKAHKSKSNVDNNKNNERMNRNILSYTFFYYCIPIVYFHSFQQTDRHTKESKYKNRHPHTHTHKLTPLN